MTGVLVLAGLAVLAAWPSLTRASCRWVARRVTRRRRLIVLAVTMTVGVAVGLIGAYLIAAESKLAAIAAATIAIVVDRAWRHRTRPLA